MRKRFRQWERLSIRFAFPDKGLLYQAAWKWIYPMRRWMAVNSNHQNSNRTAEMRYRHEISSGIR